MEILQVLIPGFFYKKHLTTIKKYVILQVLYNMRYITTQRISPASAGGGFYLTKQSEYNLRLSGNRFYESPLLVKSRALKIINLTG